MMTNRELLELAAKAAGYSLGKPLPNHTMQELDDLVATLREEILK